MPVDTAGKADAYRFTVRCEGPSANGKNAAGRMAPHAMHTVPLAKTVTRPLLYTVRLPFFNKRKPGGDDA